MWDISGVGKIASPAKAGAPRRSRRFLALASDKQLVAQVRGGNEAAFELLFDRYSKGIMSFCRHMLGSKEDAEDAVQHTFAAAYRDLVRPGDRELRLKPWLYTIARNRCLSVLRARRDELHVEREPATAGLAEEVEQRAELRELLGDIGELPAEQRAALLLAEAADLSHAEIADVLGCKAARVKALVFRARSALIERHEARETPCEEIREQLAVLSGGSLRRSSIRYHLAACEGCREYREHVKRQRRLLAVALPVAPPAWLKAHVLGAGGVASTAAASTTAGSALLAKAVVLTVLAGGGAAATEAALDRHEPSSTGSAPAGQRHALPQQLRGHEGVPGTPQSGADRAREPTARGKGKHGNAGHRHAAQGSRGGNGVARGPAAVPGSRGRGAGRRSSHANGVSHGRGPPAAPPSHTPVRRGPRAKSTPAHPAHPARPRQQLDTTTPGNGFGRRKTD